MRDFLGVQIFDAFDDLGEELASVVFAEIAVFLQSAEEFATLAEATSAKVVLLDQIQILVVLEGLVESYDHGVVQLAKDGDLVLQALRVLDHLLDDEFDGAVGMGGFLQLGLVDDSIGSPA